MSGKLIVIEAGSDASGKATQTKLLFDHLIQDQYKVKMIQFPNYSSPSSALVKMYLGGDLGKNPEDVNAYAASTFFAVDRYASYVREWKQFYAEGGIVIADRYTTSNMVHQAAKIYQQDKRREFLQWLKEFEFQKLGLPQPDLVFFLDVPPEISLSLLKARNLSNKEQAHDIHEESQDHLRMAYSTACQVAETFNWNYICCTHQGRMLSKEAIHDKIYQQVLTLL